MPPALNFAPLENARECADARGGPVRKAREAAPVAAASAAGAAAVNARLIQSERQLTDPAGLPRRPWYRHLLYAPGFYTGYAREDDARRREAIEQKAYAEAEAEMVRVAQALDRETALLESAASELERAPR